VLRVLVVGNTERAAIARVVEFAKDPKNWYRPYGITLHAARKRSGKSLTELASAIGVSDPFLDDVEHGRRMPMSPERTEAAAKALGVDRSELGSQTIPGDDSRYTLQLWDFRCVFTITAIPGETSRHLSVSIPSETAVPHPAMIEEIARAFGFTGSFGDWSVATDQVRLHGVERGILVVGQPYKEGTS
jgi:transcriptional regulator with XRE-family HTH domain